MHGIVWAEAPFFSRVLGFRLLVLGFRLLVGAVLVGAELGLS